MAGRAPSAEQVASLRVLAHPLRLRMLSLLTGCAYSASELSRELGISQALASYHLRQLHRAGVVQLAEVRPRRGGRERRFIYVPSSGPRGAGTAEAEDLALFAEALCVELRRRARHARPGAPKLGVDAELWVAPEDWKSAVDTIRAASTALHEVAKRPRAAGAIRVSVSALLFSMMAVEASAAEDE